VTAIAAVPICAFFLLLSFPLPVLLQTVYD